MTKKALCFILLIISLFLVSCTTNNPTTVVNNNYLVAEFQEGVLPYSGYNGCEDTNMADASPYYDYNFGVSSEGSMGYYNSSYITRYLVKFDIGTIPAGVKVKKAYLTLYSYATGGTGTISAHKKTSGWLEGINNGTTGTPSWNSTSGGAAFDAAASGTVAIEGEKYYTFELNTTMVQAWVSDSSENFGVIIKGDNETVNSWIWCYFSESLIPSTRPKLTVYYTIE